MSAELIDVDALPLQRWKNGAGSMRDLASAPPDAGWEAFDWRISIAEIAQDAPFSAFPGLDRCIVLLRGAGARLRSADGTLRVMDRIGEPVEFAGEEGIAATLIDGPSSNLSVMVRRAGHRAHVRWCTTRVDAPGSDARLVLGCAGAWQIDGVERRLGAGQALVWRDAMPPAALHPLAAHSAALLVSIHRRREPSDA